MEQRTRPQPRRSLGTQLRATALAAAAFLFGASIAVCGTAFAEVSPERGGTLEFAVPVQISWSCSYQATALQARAVLEVAAPSLRLLVVAERDAPHILGFTEAGERLATATAARYGVVLSRPRCRAGNPILARGEFRHAPRYPVDVVDRIGAGDSLAAGPIHRLLDGDFDLANPSRCPLPRRSGSLRQGTSTISAPRMSPASRPDTIGGLER